MNEDGGNYELGRMASEIDKAAQDARRYRAMDFWKPYPKQLEFFATGKRFRERGLFAGTQLGKTESAAYECACHLTGLYGPDWPGRRFDKPIKMWAVGDNLKMTRDIMQKKLLGEPGNVEAFGSGMIPKHLIVGDPILARGEGNAFDTVQVRHKAGGISTLRFRTYQAGRAALQGETLDLVWCDEEPELYEVYSELLARISATNGCLLITFTPLRGMSEISVRYREQFSPERTFVQMGLKDIPFDGHIPPQQRAAIIDGYPEHEREARVNGEPMLGEGKVYKTPEERIIEDSNWQQWPLYWRWGYGIDLGVDHPWSAVLLAHDVDQDVIHLVAELCASDLPANAQVSQMRNLEQRMFGRVMNFVVAWPADAGTRDRGSGESMRSIYKQLGLRMMDEPASLPNLKGVAAVSLEGGVAEIDARERAGKWKVARNMTYYLGERRLYHRKDGEIVRLKDDTLAAARYGYVMRRNFRTLDESGGAYPGTNPGVASIYRQQTAAPQQSRIARGVDDWDVFTGR
jgi:phage terminase large subunit-like protein